MHYQDAVSRRATLRSGQTQAAGVTPESFDSAMLEACAIQYGVPPRVASTIRRDLPDGEREVATASVNDVVKSPDGPRQHGLGVFSAKLDAAAAVAAAVYNGTVIRGHSSKWLSYPELVVKLNSKISMSAESSEWEQGALMDWNFELDSMRYCYDTVVIHGLDDALTTEYVLRELYSLLSIRLGRELYTVLTWQSGRVTAEGMLQKIVMPLVEESYSTHKVETRTLVGATRAR